MLIRAIRGLLLSVIFIGPAFGAGKGDVGTSAAPFLKLAPDPRAAAMGEAFVSVADEASAVHFNPAGLATLEHMSVQVSQAFYLESISYQFAGYAQPVAALFHTFETGPGRLPAVSGPPPWGVLGAAVTYVNVGSIAKYDNTGTKAGSFSPNDLSASLAYAKGFDTVDLGIAGKFVESKIDRVATGFAADLGARYRTHAGEHPVVLAAAVRNAGTSLKFNKQADPIPLTFVAGGSIRPAKDIVVALDVLAPRDNVVSVAAGVEATRAVKGDLKVSLRGGYRTQPGASGLSTIAGVSAGAGVAFPLFRVDYAWVPFGDLGDTHRIGLSFRF